MLGKFSKFCCRLPNFFQNEFCQKEDSIRNNIKMSNGLDPDQDRRSVERVGPDPTVGTYYQ